MTGSPRFETNPMIKDLFFDLSSVLSPYFLRDSETSEDESPVLREVGGKVLGKTSADDVAISLFVPGRAFFLSRIFISGAVNFLTPS